MKINKKDIEETLKLISNNIDKDQIKFFEKIINEKDIYNIETIDDFYHNLIYPYNQFISGLIKLKIFKNKDVIFILKNSSYIEDHYVYWIEKIEGITCSADKSRTILNRLLKFYNTNEEIKFDYDQEFTYHLPKKIFENKKINSIWSNGKRDIHIIKLNNNRKPKSTTNHKILTDLGWKRLDELKIGDAILSNSVGYTNYTLPTEDQRNIVIGSSIGNGSIHKLKSQNLFRLRCVHGTEQKEYLEWKAKIMNSESFVVKNNGYSGNDIHKFNTRGLYFRENLKKHSEIIKCLNQKSLAILWMDDGHKTKLENSGTFYALAPYEDSVKLLQQKLLNTFNIETTMRCRKSSSTKRKYYCLLLNKENLHKLSSLIAPYIHPSMKYKILTKHHIFIDLNNWSYDYNKYGCMIVNKEHEFLKH